MRGHHHQQQQQQQRWSPCQPHTCFSGRGSSDTRMWEMYLEYADIASSDEAPGRMKARLAALSAFAESQGVRGQAALDGLRRINSELYLELLDTRRFTLFYRFVFFMCRETGQKSMSVSTAVEAWRLSLTGRFRLLDQWCAFVQKHQRYAISEDTWRQVLEFSRNVHEDLSNYDSEGAWPVLVDDFAEFMCRKPCCAECNMEETSSCTCKNEAISNPASDAVDVHQALGNILPSVPGMSVSIGTKRRRSDPRDEAAEAESVNCIVQRLAEMPSWKRVRSCLPPVDMVDLMEDSMAEMNRGQDMTLDSMEMPEQPGIIDVAGADMGSRQVQSREAMACLDNTEVLLQPSAWPNVNALPCIMHGSF